MKLRSLSTRIKPAVTTLLVLALAAWPKPAASYTFSGVGGALGYANPHDHDGTASVGVHAEFEQARSRLHLMPNVMYWKVNGTRDFSTNFDAYYHFNPEGTISPYLGTGLGLHFRHDDFRDRSDTQPGLDLIGGLRLPGASSHYFMEGRYTASDNSQFQLLGGVTFHVR